MAKDRVRADGVDVVHKQLVGLTHVTRVQSLDPQDLRAAMEQPLSSLLFGAPLSGPRCVHALSASLNACLRLAVASLEAGARFGGDSVALRQATLEWGRLITMPPSAHAIKARRAAVLFALHVDDAFAELFVPGNPALMHDLKQRVLPLCTPPFVRGMAQNPDSFVCAVLLLCELWEGECMGMEGAHVHEPAGRLADAGDGKR